MSTEHGERQLPDVMNPSTLRDFLFSRYRKTAVTRAMGPVTLSVSTDIDTSEGTIELPAGWVGWIAIDADGMPYPIEKTIFEKTYEEAQ